MTDSDFFQANGTNDLGQAVGDFEAPALSDSDYAEHTAKMMANALEATRLIEIVEVMAGPGQVHLLGRVKKDNEREFMERVGWPALEVSWDNSIKTHVGTQYFLRKSKDKRRYGWVFSFAHTDLRGAANLICQSFAGVAPRFEVAEAPLRGPGTPQGMVTSGGKGAGKKGASAVRQ